MDTLPVRERVNLSNVRNKQRSLRFDLSYFWNKQRLLRFDLFRFLNKQSSLCFDLLKFRISKVRFASIFKKCQDRSFVPLRFDIVDIATLRHWTSNGKSLIVEERILRFVFVP